MASMNMDHGGHRKKGRLRTEKYRSVPDQWMMPQHLGKDHSSLKLMAITSERDRAVQDLKMALSEKKVALAQRDMAILQRDAAITDRNNAIAERDCAIAALENLKAAGGHGSTKDVIPTPPSPPLPTLPSPPLLADAPYDHVRGMHISEAVPVSAQPSKQPRKEDEVKKKCKRGIELNGAGFDEPAAISAGCSCTGTFRRCYKWSKGGWQSSCCTRKMSEYPLPLVPYRRNARIGGRKMSGSAFAKLVARLAAQGHDVLRPLDLKDHWAKHGTNK